MKNSRLKADGGSEQGRNRALGMEREINFLGFADYVEPSHAKEQLFRIREDLVQALESKVKVTGADAFYQLRFKVGRHLSQSVPRRPNHVRCPRIERMIE